MGEFQKRGFNTSKYTFLNIIDRLSFTKILFIWIIMIIVFGFVYFFISFSQANSLVYQGETISANTEGLFNSIYFSFVSATTTGYGDISPQGLSRLFAIFEVIFGVIISGIIISKLVGVKQEVILEEVYNISYEEVVDRLKNGLYLFRSDINRTMEKLDTGTIKPRELKDLWILFSGFDNSLTNIKNFIIPNKTDSYYSKKLDTLKLELLLNSIKLSMKKTIDFIRVLKIRRIEWRNELLLTSVYYEIQVVTEIIDYESKKTTDKKVIDRLNELRIIIADIDMELKPEIRSDHHQEFVKTEDLKKHEKEKKHEPEQMPQQDEASEPDDISEELVPPVPDRIETNPEQDELPELKDNEPKQD